MKKLGLSNENYCLISDHVFLVKFNDFHKKCTVRFKKIASIISHQLNKSVLMFPFLNFQMNNFIKFVIHKELTQIIQVSMFPKIHLPFSIASLTPGTLSIIHFIFNALKYVLTGRPHKFCRKFWGRLPFCSISSTVLEVLISNHTEKPWNIKDYF